MLCFVWGIIVRFDRLDVKHLSTSRHQLHHILMYSLQVNSVCISELLSNRIVLLFYFRLWFIAFFIVLCVCLLR